MSGVSVAVVLWALLVSMIAWRLHLFSMATRWAWKESDRLRKDARARGFNGFPYIDAVFIRSGRPFEAVLNLRKWRYVHFYPELDRLRKEAG